MAISEIRQSQEAVIPPGWFESKIVQPNTRPLRPHVQPYDEKRLLIWQFDHRAIQLARTLLDFDFAWPAVEQMEFKRHCKSQLF